jgi:hypothetical protein
VGISEVFEGSIRALRQYTPVGWSTLREKISARPS